MKTYSEFISEAYLILEKRGGPSYNYEVALERLYNHLIKGDNRANVMGKRMRLAVSRGDMDTVTDIIAQELNKAQNDPKHPLHFDNAPDEGFTGGKKTEDHRQSYYDNLKDQSFTVLNDVQSRTGRSIGARGSVAKRQGEDKVELSPSAQRLYDKIQDTSKPDMVFQDPVRPERVSKTSLKKASGAVAASSGAEETYGNIGIAVDSAIKKLLKSGKISKPEADELRFSGMSIAGKIRNVMRGSKGQDQEELLPQVNKLQGELENILPGVSREIGVEQMSGQGKYGKSGGVDRYITTGKGGGTIEDPREFGIDQRARKGKGTTKTKEGPVQRPMAVTADIRKSTTGDSSSFTSFSQRATQAHAQTAAELEKQTVQTANDLEAAKASVADASRVTKPDGTPVPRKNAFYLQNNPDAAQQHAEKQAAAAQSVQAAQDAHNNAVTTHQTHLSTPPTPPKPEKPKAPRLTKPVPVPTPQPTQAPTTEPQQTTQSEPTQQEDPKEKRRREMRERMLSGT